MATSIPSHIIPSAEPTQRDQYDQGQIEVFGAREHNLKNIDVKLPRNKLVVITGVSGSGKSSLAFDTIYAEGQRRYMESFAAYARNFMGNLERPDVDKINGLSPVIAIEQKTTSRNPRSTVGTLTEIYDYLRLLFARASEAYSYLSGQKMVQHTEKQILTHILQQFSDQQVTLLAPLVKGRKGHYRELFQKIKRLGFSKVRVNGKVMPVSAKMQLDRYKIHDIELVIDHLLLNQVELPRLSNALNLAFKQGKGNIILVDAREKLHYFSKALMDPATGLSYNEPAPNTFSFNSPYGACPTCDGLGTIIDVDVPRLIPDPTLSIAQGAIAPLGKKPDTWTFKKLTALLTFHGFSIDTPIQELPEFVLQTILHGTKSKIGAAPKLDSGTLPIQFAGILSLNMPQQATAKDKAPSEQDVYSHILVCPDCQGTRLQPQALHFKIADKNIAELATIDMKQLYGWFDDLEPKLNNKQKIIATELIKEIKKRIQFILDVGLDYLQLNRPLQTLSGGEAQRIRLATQIGTQLVNVLYILDEPSIGLHQRDNMRLIFALKGLRDLGNSLLVVEHDKDIMLHADYIIDIGPGAGRHGGKVVAAGIPHKFLAQTSATADFLTGKRQITIPHQRRAGNGKYITLSGCTGNNLKNITLTMPLAKMICITGVSGSGKSTLIHNTLVPIVKNHLYKSYNKALPYQNVLGLEYIDKVIEIDQKPIGRTPRSNPATYTNVFADIRTFFTLLPEAKIRGYQPGRFSFNTKGGRCETCQGAGMKLIEMDFLPAIHIPCETCQGKRYNRQTLEVQYKGHSIADVLDMTIDNALVFFEKHAKILRTIKTLADVGLGYLTLGQHATTLSGGEAQRIKLATELSKKDTGQTLYILDEPTTGLHFQDIQYLLDVLNKLVEKGNTVLVIEHNLDMIKVADYIIDLGPEGGSQGGTIMVEGTPEEVAQNQQSYTAYFLREALKNP
jgi:excinuclease ABC subunit A